MVTILDEIQALSDERQQLWRIAHRDKFSRDWRRRHDRIDAIGKQLDKLWHMRRVELADTAEDYQITEIDRLSSEYFDDYREHVGWYHVGDWRIEDEAEAERRYMHVADGFREISRLRDLKKQTQKRAKRPNVGARQRNRAIQGMIQLS